MEIEVNTVGHLKRILRPITDECKINPIIVEYEYEPPKDF